MALPLVPIAMGLAKVIPGIIGMFRGKDAEQTAEKVVNMAQSITGIQDPQQAIGELTNNPELLIRFKTKLLDHTLDMRQADNKQLEIINQTIRAEQQSKDRFTRWWRPTFGYCVAIAWLGMFLAVSTMAGIAVWRNPAEAGTIIKSIGQMLSSTSMLWGVALAILGVSVSKRSQDKELAAGAGPSLGIVGGLINKLRK